MIRRGGSVLGLHRLRWSGRGQVFQPGDVLKQITTALSASLLCATAAQAGSITITPDTVPDAQEPRVNYGDAPAGYGPDSWQDSATDKVNWHARYGADGDYLTSLFGADAANMTINNLVSISYNVKSTTEHWFLKIYTRPDGENDNSSWYGERFTNNYTSIATDDEWHEQSTDGTMVFSNDFNSGESGLSLADLQGSYGNELVEMISVQTNSGPGIAGFMDGLTIVANFGGDDVTGTVDFVSAPVPSPMAALGGMGLLGLVSLRRRLA